MSITDYAVLGIVVLGVIWGIVALLKKYWPASATSVAGSVAVQVADTTQAWSAYTALSAIRFLDSVEADPKAVEACEYLRTVVTTWKRPTPTA